jgi:hypothetical protein
MSPCLSNSLRRIAGRIDDSGDTGFARFYHGPAPKTDQQSRILSHAKQQL